MAGASPLRKIYPLFVIKTTIAIHTRVSLEDPESWGLFQTSVASRPAGKTFQGQAAGPSRDPQGSMALPLTAGVLGATANPTEPGGLLRL